MTLVLAHRGDHRHHPENTIAAFEAARAAGADGVELDARRTADGVLVVHHDHEVAGGAAIELVRAEELPSHVPTLSAALDTCAGLLVNIEIKRARSEPAGASTAQLVVALLQARRRADRVVISSFAPDALEEAAAPWADRAWLVPPVAESLDLVAVALDRGYRGIHPADGRVDAALVAAAHAAGLAVRAWTVNAPQRARALADLGVDAIITDDVPAIRLALA
jgi:glycerophosphoryl diester phosphodiesterase